METIEYVFSILICGVIGFALGYLSAGVKAAQKAKKALVAQHKTEEISQSDSIPQDSKQMSFQGSVAKIAREIIAQSDQKQESFMKILEYCELNQNVSKYEVLRKVLEFRKVIFFDEIIDLFKDRSYIQAKDIPAEQRPGHFLSDEDILFILSKTGNKYFSKILQDKNFKDNNSLRILNIIDENFLTDDPVIEYFIMGDGMKHWDNPEAEKFIIMVLSVLSCETDENITDLEKAFLQYFSEEKEIIERLLHLKDAAFSEFLFNCDRKKLENIIGYLKLDKSYYMLDFLESNAWIFKIWLEKTKEIYDSILFKYLVWNKILPERFMSDERYSAALKLEKKYFTPERDLVAIKSQAENEELISYVIQKGEQKEFLKACHDESTFVPCLYWYTLGKNKKWQKMTQKVATKLVESDKDFEEEPFVNFSYLLEGYTFSSKKLNNVCLNNVVEIAQLYFEMHHQKHFS